MRLTKLRVLELCEEMWRWLAKHPNKEKLDWPGWKVNGGEYSSVLEECFACEYTRQRKRINNRINCKLCPLKMVWGFKNANTADKFFCDHGECALCVNENSPYKKWDNGINRKKNALIIADFCAEEIKKLKRKKKCL